MMQVRQYNERRTRLLRAIRQYAYAEHGFSLIELMVVVIILIILSALAIPVISSMTQSLRISGDIRGISAQLSLARMTAASKGAKTQLNFNLTANTYQIEVYNSSAGAYQLQGGVTSLSNSDSFGFGSLTTPAGQQSTIAETSPIYFNSRGIATDSSGNATANSAIYVTNTQGQYFAVAVSIAGQPTAYRYSGSAWVPY